ITLGNYRLWIDEEIVYGNVFSNFIYRGLLVVLLLASGISVFYYIILYLTFSADRLLWKQSDKDFNPRKVFIISFLIISLTNLIILFLCKYPGSITADGIFQIKQFLSGEYDNKNPFYHTMLIRMIMEPIYNATGNMNTAMAAFCVFQIIVMALIFSYTVATICSMKTPRFIWGLVFVYYFIMPYHMMNSMTVLKDVLFSGITLLFITCMIRLFENIGNSIANLILLFVSTAGIGMLRSGIIYILGLAIVIYGLIFKGENKKVLITMISAFVVGFMLEVVLLSTIGIEGSDDPEYLSLPAQQIARVIVDDNDLTMGELVFLDQVMPIEKVPQTYVNWIADPIKDLIRETGNEEFIKDNAEAFIKLYIRTGLRHPKEYLKAWVDQTSGFWTGAYNSYVVLDLIPDWNDIGLERTVKVKNLKIFVDRYFQLFRDRPFTAPLRAPGMLLWVEMLLLYLARRRKDRTGTFVVVPGLVILLTLAISSPVIDEFRYAYPVFCMIPLVLVYVLRGNVPTVVGADTKGSNSVNEI
ncbi:MAG: DUF6020 family protein, partial [Lachnospiraceae bacterium]|nr:DUF6020 family protein [Lachnospiraceae bacterium]